MRVELVIKIVLAKGNDWYQICASLESELDESFTFLDDKVHRVRLSFKRLSCTAHDNGDGPAHTLFIRSTAGEKIGDRFFAHGLYAHRQDIFTIQGQAKIGIQGQQAVGDARKLLRKSESIGCEGRPGSVRNNPVRMVSKDILARRDQIMGLVQFGREVLRKVSPNW